MPNIIACYKWVPDEQDIKLNPSTMALDFSKAKYKISEYDRNAIEEAVLLNQKNGGSVTALTFGNAGAKQSLKDALSRGPGKAIFVNDELAAKSDAYVTANVLAAAVRKAGSYDVILCGEGAGDTYAQQVGPRIAAILGIPAVTYVSEIKIEGNKVVATRKVGNCTEVATVEFPVLISVLPEINKPRIPSLKEVLGATKKPVFEYKLSELELSEDELTAKNNVKAIKGYVMSRKNVIYKAGTAAERVASLVGNLAQEGVL
ncbi:electron transfer flavoprotein subunit beta/FixA family protein [Sporomusa acidovorans]|uniref:Electron transfer flavoprotein small subunit n=1 Tax=Sporomusa acidovorans (strain ATCC 49682 / DSM 3132 / Mol) TaxID=1123286 RepID=A0ABZ3J6E1_SPOA4|nr:electron transfer flavoprotein subunit beta/FixA family protein [Sporomusa acidovorans]OZC24310.1 electron transfer flavoprotein subunit beta [Sporomusa acidovorans DSM 3132]SDF02334.1 electron transfer flavoprotein beta subunit [Sporomusa acidovorans]